MKKILCLGTVLIAIFASATDTPGTTRTEDVIYGRKFGTALTLDVFRPAKPNGAGLIWVVSGGWFSGHDAINPWSCEPFLKRGYTVFAVVHGSQPKYTIPEVQSDIHRAVRFIRHNAGTYGVNPKQLGIYGSSAGGHLTLTLATQGQANPGAKDAVDAESSAIQCAACFFPPTDFLNYSREGDNAVGTGTLKDYQPAFGPRANLPEDRELYGRELSPIYFVHSNMPPVLIIHGDADKLVPIYQSQQFVTRCESVGATAKLIPREGKVHGWPGMEKDLEIFAGWFDEHLFKPQTK